MVVSVAYAVSPVVLSCFGFPGQATTPRLLTSSSVVELTVQSSAAEDGSIGLHAELRPLRRREEAGEQVLTR